MTVRAMVRLAMVLALVVAVGIPCGAVAQEEGGEEEGLPTLELSAEGIAAVLAFGLSLLVEIVPGFKGFWESFAYKRTAWAIGGLAVALGMAVLDATGMVSLGIPTPFLYAGLAAVLRAWLMFAGSGQLTYSFVARMVAERFSEPF